jgi:hypothetical protein
MGNVGTIEIECAYEIADLPDFVAEIINKPRITL